MTDKFRVTKYEIARAKGEFQIKVERFPEDVVVDIRGRQSGARLREWHQTAALGDEIIAK